jgi:cobalamin synthase
MTEAREANERGAKRMRRLLLSAQGLVTVAPLTVVVGWSLCVISSLPSCASVAGGMSYSEYAGRRTLQEHQEDALGLFTPIFYGLAVLGWVAAVLFLAVTWPLSWWASRRLGRRIEEARQTTDDESKQR